MIGGVTEGEELLDGADWGGALIEEQIEAIVVVGSTLDTIEVCSANGEGLEHDVVATTAPGDVLPSCSSPSESIGSVLDFLAGGGCDDFPCCKLDARERDIEGAGDTGCALGHVDGNGVFIVENETLVEHRLGNLSTAGLEPYKGDTEVFVAGQGAHLVECLKSEHLWQAVGLELVENFLEQWEQQLGGLGNVLGI